MCAAAISTTRRSSRSGRRPRACAPSSSFSRLAAIARPHVRDRWLNAPGGEPFWATAARLRAFIFIHPHGGAGAERLGSYYLKNLIGLPFETTIAGASLVFGGVLE